MTTEAMTATEKLKGSQLEWPREVTTTLLRSGRNVWLAGLGAAGSVGELGRDGFAQLVERGRAFEQKERPALEEQLEDGKEQIDRLGRRGSERIRVWTRGAERRFEEGVDRALERFGVPNRDEVRSLIDRIEQLTKKVESITARS